MSRGVGVTFLPIRIDAPPEIPIVTMVAKSEPAKRAHAARMSMSLAGNCDDAD